MVIVIFDFVMVFIGELISGVFREIFFVSVDVRLILFVVKLMNFGKIRKLLYVKFVLFLNNWFVVRLFFGI